MDGAIVDTSINIGHNKTVGKTPIANKFVHSFVDLLPIYTKLIVNHLTLIKNINYTNN